MVKRFYLVKITKKVRGTIVHLYYPPVLLDQFVSLTYSKDMTEVLIMVEADEKRHSVISRTPSIESLTIEKADMLGKQHQPELRIKRPKITFDKFGFPVEKMDDKGNIETETVTRPAFNIKRWL